MTNTTSVDCSQLGTRTDFKNYINLLSNVTGGNFSLVSGCKSEVCTALWGSGNPDISGVGMTIGYILEVAIGVALTLIFLVLCIWPTPENSRRWKVILSKMLYTWPTPENLRCWKVILSKTFKAYHDSAIFLTFSVQVASVVMLVKANFGISADGMGANTMEITWIVSLLTLLPLCYGVFIFRLRDEEKLLQNDREAMGGSDGSGVNNSQVPSREGLGSEATIKGKSAKVGAKDRLRFMLFVISWMISAYPFFSRMVCTFGKFCHEPRPVLF